MWVGDVVLVVLLLVVMVGGGWGGGWELVLVSSRAHEHEKVARVGRCLRWPQARFRDDPTGCER